jgi:plastocyanin
MLERLWTSILELMAQVVTPDWGVLISLIPVGVLILVVVILLWLFLKLAKAPPARRGKGRVTRRTPAGIHMPGPSFAPVFAGVGLFLVMLGLVFGGLILVLGVIALVLTLLYWLAEGLRLYDHDIGPTAPELPPEIHEGPPPGVHMPGPSWRPFLGAFGVFALFLGLVFGGWLLAVGVIALITTLIGWLTDAVLDYRRVVEAESTGHIDSGPPPATPRRLFTVLVVLIVGAAVLQSGVFTTDSAAGAGGATASGSPGAPPPASGPPASGPAASGPPASGQPPGGPVAADATVHAQGIAFVETTFTAPAGKPFTLAFVNEDQGTPHNVELKDASGGVAYKGEVFNGVETRVYQVPALPAGTYPYVCSIHSNMTGTATLQ